MLRNGMHECSNRLRFFDSVVSVRVAIPILRSIAILIPNYLLNSAKGLGEGDSVLIYILFLLQFFDRDP